MNNISFLYAINYAKAAIVDIENKRISNKKEATFGIIFKKFTYLDLHFSNRAPHYVVRLLIDKGYHDEEPGRSKVILSVENENGDYEKVGVIRYSYPYDIECFNHFIDRIVSQMEMEKSHPPLLKKYTDRFQIILDDIYKNHLTEKNSKLN